MPWPFSILVQIVGSATTPKAWPKCSNTVIFQYPRADRGECNRQGQRGVRCAKRFFQYPRADRGECNFLWCSRSFSGYSTLSVSSCRSWGVQLPCRTCSTQCVSRSFSILVQIVGSATIAIGINTYLSPFFQYPRADRGECNVSRQRWKTEGRARLSVSSCRSWGVQLGGR